MLKEIDEMIGLSVYTPNGAYVGNVDNVVMDIDGRKIDGLFIRNSSPALVEDGVAINVPYRWVRAVGDIVLLKVFPEKVMIGRE